VSPSKSLMKEIQLASILRRSANPSGGKLQTERYAQQVDFVADRLAEFNFEQNLFTDKVTLAFVTWCGLELRSTHTC